MTNLLEFVGKKSVRGAMCAIALVSSMSVFNVPKMYAFTRCYAVVCSDDLSTCVRVEMPCPQKPGPGTVVT